MTVPQGLENIDFIFSDPRRVIIIIIIIKIIIIIIIKIIVKQTQIYRKKEEEQFRALEFLVREQVALKTPPYQELPRQVAGHGTFFGPPAVNASNSIENHVSQVVLRWKKRR